jgi:hypothetical protein
VTVFVPADGSYAFVQGDDDFHISGLMIWDRGIKV